MGFADVFAGDAFSAISLTEAINKLPYKPSRIGEMGLFGSRGVPTQTVVIEEKDGWLSLVPTTAWGGPATPTAAGARRARSFVIPHLALEHTVLASDVQNVRAFGSESNLEGVSTLINDNLEWMRQSMEVTTEYHRIGAVTGNILDADGVTSIYNLFTEYGKTQVSVDFTLGTAATKIRSKCLDVIRGIEQKLGAAPYNHVHAICHADFFDALISHSDVEAAYERWMDGEFLRSDPRAGFTFGGITWEEYRGSLGTQSFLTANECRFFPVGTPQLFMTYYGPADFIEAVNTPGQPVYAKQAVDAEFQRWVKLHVQSNPLCMCTRPEVLYRGHTST